MTSLLSLSTIPASSLDPVRVFVWAVPRRSVRSLKTSLVKAGPLSVTRSSGTPNILTWLSSERANSLAFVVLGAIPTEAIDDYSNMPVVEIILWEIFDVVDHKCLHRMVC